ncbi:MAG: YebC/PmpR family DNA-binding transcriptional regulator [Candidatus Magasanikbacteria bacterium]|nr:YebC/PmpR family DNA-binding transcriptional regulator [Candidatus Magasanikbacteria bacterium]
MSGHSKWHNIQVKKGKADKARSGTFTKLSRAVTVAAQQGGGDAEMNFALRIAIDNAKLANMPKENIERAIKRGTGELRDEAVLHESIYEVFGPGGVAMLIEALTGNVNRTVSEIKGILNKFGGILGSPGSVQWQFELRGVVRFTADKKFALSNWEAVELELMDAGVDDMIETEDGVELFFSKEYFQKMMEVIAKHGIEQDDSGLQWIAKEEIIVDDETNEKVTRLVEALDDLDDVKDVFTNLS